MVLREHVDLLTVKGARFVVALGDLYWKPTEPRLQEFRQWVQTNVHVPFFNAVGNHDVGGRGRADNYAANYAAAFGPLWFDFALGSELFVFLDLENLNHELGKDQWSLFRRAMKRAADDDAIRNVFVFTHKLVWSYNNPEMPAVFSYRHPVRVEEDYDYFAKHMKPVLVSVAKQGKNVYLMAGDIGGSAAHLQMFYHRDEHLTYVATGMGYPSRDGFVEVSLKNGNVSMQAISFETGQAKPIEVYDNIFWTEFYEENPEWALKALPEYWKNKRGQ